MDKSELLGEKTKGTKYWAGERESSLRSVEAKSWSSHSLVPRPLVRGVTARPKGRWRGWSSGPDPQRRRKKRKGWLALPSRLVRTVAEAATGGGLVSWELVRKLALKARTSKVESDEWRWPGGRRLAEREAWRTTIKLAFYIF